MTIINPLYPPTVGAGGVPNVVPFTIRENPSQVYIIESMRVWINDQLVPFINDNINQLAEDWVSNVTDLIETWEELSISLVEQVQEIAEGVGTAVEDAQAAQSAAEDARDLAEQYASTVVAFQDSAVGALIDDTDSVTRIALDNVYATITDLESVSNFVDDINDVINTGRLSAPVLDQHIIDLSVNNIPDDLVTSQQVNTIAVVQNDEDVSSFPNGTLVIVDGANTTRTDFRFGLEEIYPIWNAPETWEAVTGGITNTYTTPGTSNRAFVLKNVRDDVRNAEVLIKASYSASYTGISICALARADMAESGIYLGLQTATDDGSASGGIRMNAVVEGEVNTLGYVTGGTVFNSPSLNTAETDYYLRLRVVDNSVNGKVWPVGSPEPTAWQVYISPSLLSERFKTGENARGMVGFYQRNVRPFVVKYMAVDLDGKTAPTEEEI